MDPTDQTDPAQRLLAMFSTPARIVLTVCQMLLGLGLAVALILRAYMFVFTDHACVADAASLGNVIRCTPVLAMLAQFAMLMAAFRFAALLFLPRLGPLFEVLLLAVAGVLLRLLSDLSLTAASWDLAALILALCVALTGAALARHYLTRESDQK